MTPPADSAASTHSRGPTRRGFSSDHVPPARGGAPARPSPVTTHDSPHTLAAAAAAPSPRSREPPRPLQDRLLSISRGPLPVKARPRSAHNLLFQRGASPPHELSHELSHERSPERSHELSHESSHEFFSREPFMPLSIKSFTRTFMESTAARALPTLPQMVRPTARPSARSCGAHSPPTGSSAPALRPSGRRGLPPARLLSFGRLHVMFTHDTARIRDATCVSLAPIGCTIHKCWHDVRPGPSPAPHRLWQRRIGVPNRRTDLEKITRLTGVSRLLISGAPPPPRRFAGQLESRPPAAPLASPAYPRYRRGVASERRSTRMTGPSSRARAARVPPRPSGLGRRCETQGSRSRCVKRRLPGP